MLMLMLIIIAILLFLILLVLIGSTETGNIMLWMIGGFIALLFIGFALTG